MRHLGKTSRLGCVWSISSSSVFFDHWRIEKPLERFKMPPLTNTHRHGWCLAALQKKAKRIEKDAMRGSALIQIRYKGEQYSGEIHTILQHKQRGIPRSEPVPLAFVSLDDTGRTHSITANFMWNDFLELGVETWLYKKYAPTNDPNYPPQVLPLADQISRGKLGFTIPPL
ncbi:hypothetical protein B0H14DRAFT_2556913 [Mycena olivaceomarginata]|nr:hypothetical protein B0H14DRAFT_2556913 [Mycena olivaceomarginata]